MKKVSLLLKACGNGTYGLDCGELCGHCLDKKECLNVNGSCLTGCKNGFWGPFCKLRKLSDKLLSKTTSYTKNKFQMLAKYGVHTLIRFTVFFPKACKDGMYGEKCKNICGHCRNEGICHHNNGSCLNGCNPGYIGDLCKTGKCNRQVFEYPALSSCKNDVYVFWNKRIIQFRQCRWILNSVNIVFVKTYITHFIGLIQTSD